MSWISGSYDSDALIQAWENLSHAKANECKWRSDQIIELRGPIL
jgi:hypothetical protein